MNECLGFVVIVLKNYNYVVVVEKSIFCNTDGDKVDRFQNHLLVSQHLKFIFIPGFRINARRLDRKLVPRSTRRQEPVEELQLRVQDLIICSQGALELGSFGKR